MHEIRAAKSSRKNASRRIVPPRAGLFAGESALPRARIVDMWDTVVPDPRNAAKPPLSRILENDDDPFA